MFLSPPFANLCHFKYTNCPNIRIHISIPCSCRLLHLDGGAWAVGLIASVTFRPEKEVIFSIFLATVVAV
jgi:hypothetical protein